MPVNKTTFTISMLAGSGFAALTLIALSGLPANISLDDKNNQLAELLHLPKGTLLKDLSNPSTTIVL